MIPRPTAERLPTVIASAAVGLAPVWWHLDFVDPRIGNITAVFGEVAIYPSDVCLVALGILAVRQPAPVGDRVRWLAYGLTLLAAVALLSTVSSLDPILGAGLAGHLALLVLAWLGVRSTNVSRSVLVRVLVASAVVQSFLAVAQFTLQQPLIPAVLHLPWLPSNASEGGAPVVLNAAGQRLLRGFGTFPHPNILGGYLALALVCLPLLAQRSPQRRPLWWLIGTALAAGLLASFSRAGWLAAIIGLALWWWWARRESARGRWWQLGIIPLVVAVIAVSPFASIVATRLLPLGPSSNPLERGSVQNRLALDLSALSEASHHLPLGVGAGNYGKVALAEDYQQGWGEPAPNVALLIVTELGLPGLVAALLVAFGGIRALCVRGAGVDRAAAAACLALLVLAMLDHYLWTMPLGRVIAWAPLTLLGSPAVSPPPMRVASLALPSGRT
jgi:hypothetical protein